LALGIGGDPDPEISQEHPKVPLVGAPKRLVHLKRTGSRRRANQAGTLASEASEELRGVDLRLRWREGRNDAENNLTRRRTSVARLWPNARKRRHWLRALRRAPARTQVAASLVALAALWVVANGIYQVARKPTELFFPVSGALYKTPSETWADYAPLFRTYATEQITAEFLAALAQVEGSGNPVARTYWRWSLKTNLFEVYRPASSAVGMYQITDGTFEEAKRYCIHDHIVVEQGPWYDWHSCWFNGLYFRVLPSHAIELTAAFLDHAVSMTLTAQRIPRATLAQRQRLAALVHLCGTGTGEWYARDGFVLPSDLHCGDHDVRDYIARVGAMKDLFTLLAAREQGGAVRGAGSR